MKRREGCSEKGREGSRRDEVGPEGREERRGSENEIVKAASEHGGYYYYCCCCYYYYYYYCYYYYCCYYYYEDEDERRKRQRERAGGREGRGGETTNAGPSFRRALSARVVRGLEAGFGVESSRAGVCICGEERRARAGE